MARFLGHPNRWSVLLADGGRVMVEGVQLGRLGRDHRLHRRGPGPVRAVLPATAVRLAGSDPASAHGGDGLPATIDDVVFDRGRHRVVARIGPLTEGGGGAVVEFETTRAVEVGERCRLALDLDQLQPLEGEE